MQSPEHNFMCEAMGEFACVVCGVKCPSFGHFKVWAPALHIHKACRFRSDVMLHVCRPHFMQDCTGAVVRLANYV